MKLSVIIVSFNTKDYLRQTLKSVFAEVRNIGSSFLEVIVVDNNSTDGSPEMVGKEFPQVHLIESKVNLGFGGGNNEGARKAQGNYLLFLNSDTIVLKGALPKMLDFMEKHPEIGILTPKLVWEDRKTPQAGMIGLKPTLPKMILEKPFKLFKNLVRKAPFLNRLAQKISLDFWDFNQEREVDWVTGAALLTGRVLFEKLQGFDEKIFMYFEDVDLCLRAQKLGAKVFYYPDVTIVHLGGKSIQLSRDRKKIYYQSQDYFWSKHHSLLSAISLKIIRFPYFLINLFFAK